MKKFNQTRLWAMLYNRENRNNCIEQYDAVLNEFLNELHLYCREEKNLAERTRTLRLASSELIAAKEQHYSGAEKKSLVLFGSYPSPCVA